MSNTKTSARPNQQRPTKSKGGSTSEPRRIPVVGIVIGVVVVFVIAAVVFGGGGVAETGDPQLSGEALPPYDAGQVDPAIGRAAPAALGDDFDGGEVAISPGTPTGIVFLAHWCPHCQNEVVAIQQWLDGGGGVDGVEIVSVATSVNSARSNYPPSDWLEGEGWSPTVLRDDASSSVFAAFGGTSFPYWVFVDAEGRVVARHAGVLDIDSLAGLLEMTKG